MRPHVFASHDKVMLKHFAVLNEAATQRVQPLGFIF
jgi:hypothetical protein